MSALKDPVVLILGLGISGLAMARWCTRQGARVVVADTRENPPHRERLAADCPQAELRHGCAFDEALLASADWHLIARSPGLQPQQLAPVMAHAQARGIAVAGELELFAQALDELSRRETLLPYRPKLIAVTGTNGKTTVTSLTGLLLERAGWRVAVAGNIGPALLDVLAQALDHEAQVHAEDEQRRAEKEARAVLGGAADAAAVPVEEAPTPQGDAVDAGAANATEIDPADSDPAPIAPPPPEPPQPPHLPQVWVLELSSFQLDGTAGGAWDRTPTAATVLNVTEDHLDWHGSIDAYVQAKQAVFGSGALMLLNREDSRVMAMQPGLVTVKVRGRNRQMPARAWVSFGLDAPARAGDWGIESVNGMDWLVRALPMDETRQRGRAVPHEDEIYLQRLMPADALRIRGRHNAANALAALALATSTGATLAPMLHGLREYRGEPHRVEPVGVIGEVEYFDDSKGTNVGATLAAIRGLGAERRLVVILGGDGKGQNFEPLAAPLARYARAVVLIGRDASLIREQIGGAGVPLLEAPALPEAVRLCAQQARPGDAVLMSPACASFDMFDSYVHRAHAFVEVVGELAAERGLSLAGGV